MTDIVIVIIGPRWFGERPSGKARIYDETDPVRIEVAAALAQSALVVPFLVEGTDMPQAEDLPESIKDLAFRNAAIIDSGRDFHQHIDRVIRSLDRALSERQRVATDEAERQRVLAEELERRRVAAEAAERQRIAAEEAQRQRIAAEEAERQRIAAAEAERRRAAAQERGEEEVRRRRTAERAESTGAKAAEREQLATAARDVPGASRGPESARDFPVKVAGIGSLLICLAAAFAVAHFRSPSAGGSGPRPSPQAPQTAPAPRKLALVPPRIAKQPAHATPATTSALPTTRPSSSPTGNAVVVRPSAAAKLAFAGSASPQPAPRASQTAAVPNQNRAVAAPEPTPDVTEAALAAPTGSSTTAPPGSKVALAPAPARSNAQLFATLRSRGGQAYGTATITPTEDGVRIVLQMQYSVDSQRVGLFTGSCAHLGHGTALYSISAGKSVTVENITFDTLSTAQYAIAVAASPFATFRPSGSCGNISSARR